MDQDNQYSDRAVLLHGTVSVRMFSIESPHCVRIEFLDVATFLYSAVIQSKRFCQRTDTIQAESKGHKYRFV